MIWRTHLGKVFADVLGGIAQVMTEGTGISSLASTLTEELARDVGGIYGQGVSVDLYSIYERPRIWVWRGKGRVQHATTTAITQNILGGLRGPSKRAAFARGVACELPLGLATLRLPLRAWRYSGMVYMGGVERSNSQRRNRGVGAGRRSEIKVERSKWWRRN
jgi:hypothetical protein